MDVDGISDDIIYSGIIITTNLSLVNQRLIKDRCVYNALAAFYCSTVYVYMHTALSRPTLLPAKVFLKPVAYLRWYFIATRNILFEMLHQVFFSLQILENLLNSIFFLLAKGNL